MMLKVNVTYYEILDIQPDASPQDVRDAYYRSKSAYNKDNAALYSLVSIEDREEILKEVEEAYMILSDPQKRREYDQQKQIHIITPDPMESPGSSQHLNNALSNIVSIDRVPPMESSSEDESILIPPSTDFLAPSYPTHETPPKFAPQQPSLAQEQNQSQAPFPVYKSQSVRANSHLKPLSPPIDPELLQAIETENDWNGHFLKKIREAHKISLEEMASITKVTKTYLSAIEEENFKKLPAAVYIRGFVIQVAKVLKLSHEKVAIAYLSRYHAAKKE